MLHCDSLIKIGWNSPPPPRHYYTRPNTKFVRNYNFEVFSTAPKTYENKSL